VVQGETRRRPSACRASAPSAPQPIGLARQQRAAVRALESWHSFKPRSSARIRGPPPQHHDRPAPLSSLRTRSPAGKLWRRGANPAPTRAVVVTAIRTSTTRRTLGARVRLNHPNQLRGGVRRATQTRGDDVRATPAIMDLATCTILTDWRSKNHPSKVPLQVPCSAEFAPFLGTVEDGGHAAR